MRFFEHQDTARGETRRLLFFFALAVAATVLGVHAALAAAWVALAWLLPGRLPFPAAFFAVNVGVTLLLVLGGWWIETSNLRMPGGIERLARRMGAREARPGTSYAEQRLCNVVDEVCIAAHMPRPQAMVAPRAEAINAFAMGWSEDDAIVAVTEGALDWLTREELQGMVAHECSHIHEGDTHLHMQLAGMVLGLELVHHFGQTVRERGGLGWVFGMAITVMGLFGWLAGRALQAAVSRQREYLADARAVQWTRSRDGIGGVLRKAWAQQRAAREQGAPHRSPWHPALHHMLLVDGGARGGAWLDAHPPIAERVRRIHGRAMGPLPLHPVAHTPQREGARVSEATAPAVEGPFTPA
ncbi:M48 family metalloprotease [Ramlibacter sp. H39-3-26]|uniref:M48 family metalloprotease n=1 Tax=Curvibacter soli TaxID=3031331 RepID=UPI0023DB112D|nr:M48 family metalloprotease [Ramlibacter sp. H39-3-26]MDF1484647.1 M48 family metalloprotease [Ramlibacter sp. H39-3-26]